jgi:hypothetical protein
VKAIKSTKDEISIEYKLSAIYLIDTLINFQKSLAANEFKQRKFKKKLNKLLDDRYVASIEPNAKEMRKQMLNKI